MPAFPPYTLRPVTDEDYDFLFELHCLTMKESVTPIWGWDETIQADYFKKKWHIANRYVVVVAGQDAGILEFEKRSDHYWLGLIQIHPTYQNKGLGTHLLQDLLTRARHDGLPLVLHVLKSNPQAHQLYTRLDFKVIEERVERYVLSS